MPEDCRPREHVENHGRAYLVRSASQKIPVQPGWYLPPQKILLPEHAFLQTRKEAENTKEKSRQCFTIVGVQRLRLKVLHTVCRFCTFAHPLSSYQELCRIWTGNEDVLTETHYWSIENPSLPCAVHVHCLLMHICLHRRFILASTHRFFPFLNLEIHLSLHSWNESLVFIHFLLSSIVHLKCHLRFKGSFWVSQVILNSCSDWKVQDRLAYSKVLWIIYL